MILSLVQSGSNTPYALKVAGLSVGSTLPALNRLHERRLLSRANEGARGRAEFALTPTGAKLMRLELQTLASRLKRETDPEELLRLSALALAAGGMRDAIAALSDFESQADAVGERPASRDLADIYGWMRLRVAQTMKRAERDAIRRLADDLKT